MIFDFLKKQKEITKKRKIIKLIIISLNISEEQKNLYLETILVLDSKWLEKLYISLSNSVKQIEYQELDNINKQNFSRITWLRKKEAKDKQREINSFSFLINNI